MSLKGLVLSAISIFFVLALSACGSAPPKIAAPEKTSAWLSTLIDDTSDWQIRIRPRDLAQDPVFGPVLKRAEREASAAITQAQLGETTLQALEQSDVLLLAVRTAHPIDAVLIVGGAPASTSPAALVDDRGTPLWRHIDAPGRTIDEYVPTGPNSPERPALRLVSLPGRTWIIAIGDAVERTARALSVPSPGPYRPDAAAEGRDLVDVVAVGELLAPMKHSRGEGLQPLLAPLTRVSLRIDGGHSPAAHAVLTYRDELAAVNAEDLLQTLKAVFAAKYPKFQALIDAAKVARLRRDVTIDSAIPGGLVHMLLEAGRPPRTGSAPDDIAPTAPPVAPVDPNTL